MVDGLPRSALAGPLPGPRAWHRAPEHRGSALNGHNSGKSAPICPKFWEVVPSSVVYPRSPSAAGPRARGGPQSRCPPPTGRRSAGNTRFHGSFESCPLPMGARVECCAQGPRAASRGARGPATARPGPRGGPRRPRTAFWLPVGQFSHGFGWGFLLLSDHWATCVMPSVYYMLVSNKVWSWYRDAVLRGCVITRT